MHALHALFCAKNAKRAAFKRNGMQCRCSIFKSSVPGAVLGAERFKTRVLGAMLGATKVESRNTVHNHDWCCSA